MRIYVDLDETLIANVVRNGEVVDVIPRPGMQWFIKTLSQHGDLWLLTKGNMAHVQQAFEKMGKAPGLFKGIISHETMVPIEEQIDVVVRTPGLTDDQRLELWESIPPIAPPGIHFDDYPFESPIGALKSKTIGIGPDQWIEVEPYTPGQLDRQGLKKAYSEFVARFGNQGAALGRRKRVLAWR
jgi:hypothetical protein